MATHSSTLAWKIPWTEEPIRLQSMGSQRVWHDWVTSLSLFTFHFPVLEKEMASHSSVLSWRIPGAGEPGGLPSMGLHRIGQDWSDLAAAAAADIKLRNSLWLCFPCSSVGKESACSAGDPDWIPGLGRFPGEGNGNPLQYPCLENLTDRWTWWAAVHGVAKSRARLSD